MASVASISLMGIIAFVASLLSKTLVISSRHPLEATAVAIIIGVFVRFSGLLPAKTLQTLKVYEKILIWGIIFIGASLNFREIANQGPKILLVIGLTMTLSFSVIMALIRLFRLPTDLSLLLSAGTTICGTTAIAVTAPLIKARQEAISYAVATITLWGLAAIFIYPGLAHQLGFSDLHFGVFAGTAIPATPQVVAAGFTFSSVAGKTATAVKLVRNCFIAPLALAIALWWTRAENKPKSSELNRIQWARAFPWFLFGYFFMAGLNSLGYLPAEGASYLNSIGKILILVSMAGIGLAADFKGIFKVGLKPLLVGLVAALVIASFSLIFIYLLL
ncbi:MAG: YeiH family protein [Candidatus Aminicenantales bacterium]